MLLYYCLITTGNCWCMLYALLSCSLSLFIVSLLSLCYSIMYFYNSAQRYEQFLQVGGLYRALILLGLALCLPTASVSSVLMVL